MAGNDGIDGVMMSSGTGHKSKLVEIGSNSMVTRGTAISRSVELQTSYCWPMSFSFSCWAFSKASLKRLASVISR